ncbi:hypothetical protein DSM112329_01107 [Paraconexibacter sp. AEG42_29]|uniref:Calx-beta domain-containing protein n=1 Tax=Paraconexibacter sp. AEG42_29 TaxID=2997339 RepID=A0AAU7ARE6_9ACTN
MPAIRTIAARLALTAAGPLLVACAFATPAGAQTALAPPVASAPAPAPQLVPSTLVAAGLIPTTVTEGQAVRLSTALVCKKGRGNCTFRIALKNGSATAGIDYAATRVTTHVVKAGRTKNLNLTIPTVADRTCEPAETFSVEVQSLRGRAARTDLGQMTIASDVETDPVCAAAAEDARARGEAGIE